MGAYVHGLLASDAWRGAFLNQVRRCRSLPEQPTQIAASLDWRIARWAEHVRAHLRPGAWALILAALRADTKTS